MEFPLGPKSFNQIFPTKEVNFETNLYSIANLTILSFTSSSTVCCFSSFLINLRATRQCSLFPDNSMTLSLGDRTRSLDEPSELSNVTLTFLSRNSGIPFPSHSLFLHSVPFKVYAPAEVAMFLSADISRSRLGASLLVRLLFNNNFINPGFVL